MASKFIQAWWGALAALVIAASPMPATAQPSPGPAVTHDFLYGRWTDTNDCSNGVDLHRDGRFVTTDGAQGTWRLEGGRMRFIGNSEVSPRIHATDRNTIILTHDDGTTGRSTRCPAAAERRAMPPLPESEAEALRISRPIDRSFLLGVWTDDGDCSNNIHFLADGNFAISSGGNGSWTLSGERLRFTGASTITARARGVGNDRIILIHEDYSIGQSIRC